MFDYMRKIAIILLSCLLAATSMRAGNNAGYGPVKDEQAFRKELMTRTSAVTSIQAKFIQEKYLSVFSRIVKSEGRFYWQKPDRICLAYQTPAKYRITIASDKIKTVSNGKSNVISAKGNPMMDQMSSLIAACMTGNLNAMGTGFQTVILESQSDYLITITPQSQTVRNYISKMEIYLDKKDWSVNRLVMFENATDYTGYVFSEKKFNETIPSAIFDVR